MGQHVHKAYLIALVDAEVHEGTGGIIEGGGGCFDDPAFEMLVGVDMFLFVDLAGEDGRKKVVAHIAALVGEDLYPALFFSVAEIGGFYIVYVFAFFDAVVDVPVKGGRQQHAVVVGSGIEGDVFAARAYKVQGLPAFLGEEVVAVGLFVPAAPGAVVAGFDFFVDDQNVVARKGRITKPVCQAEARGSCSYYDIVVHLHMAIMQTIRNSSAWFNTIRFPACRGIC